MATRKKPPQRVKKDDYVWPFEDTVWNHTDEYLIEHWNKLLMDCLSACAELGLDAPADVCPHNRMLDGFNLEDVLRRASNFSGRASTLLLRPPTKQSELDSQKDLLEACSDLIKVRREQEAKELRRKRAIESLTPEQKEALGF